MSKVAIKGNASGTGTFTIEAPDSNDDRTLVLPDDTGTVVYENASGNVGIGTTSPSSQLTVASNGTIEMLGGSSTLKFTREDTTTIAGNDLGAIEFAHQDTDDAGVAAKILGEGDGSSGEGRISFHTGTPSALTEAMRIDSSGNVLIGTTAIPGTGNTGGAGFVETTGDRNYLKLGHNVDSSTKRVMITLHYKNSQVGEITSSNSSTAYNTTSDYRLKENVVDMTGAIDRVKALKPSRFNFLVDPDTTVDGFLAHEAQEIVPESVTGEKDAVDADGNPEYQGIDQAKLVPLLTGALQEAIAKIETLEAKVAALEATS